MEISLRIATTAAPAAVNKIDFVSSHEGELIVLAFCDGTFVGQGRVGAVDVESDTT